ncbi:hypothetical protein [Paenibacillus sp. USHLN196]|uniref:hypothetical protein n=1 Tax=Paenibacillus sp. USHLN196 TaxID=3081291 RepID=UPI003015D4A9
MPAQRANQYNIDKAAKELLLSANWVAPQNEKIPTGKEIVEHYLKPMAALPELSPNVHLKSKVTAISRKGLSKVKTFEGNVKGFSIGCRDNPIVDKEDPIWRKNDNNCNTFKLAELYNAHKDYATELLIKSRIYNEEQIKNLLIAFPDLFQNESEVARLVLGTLPGSELESIDRVLSKFTQDILMELRALSKY